MLRHIKMVGVLSAVLGGSLAVAGTGCTTPALPAPNAPAPPSPLASPKPPAPLAAAKPSMDTNESAASSADHAGENEDTSAKGKEKERENGAKAQFEKGVDLLGQNALEAAYAAFVLSIDLFPTSSATFNAALCLQRLRRFDEALAMFEKLLRDYPDLPASDKIPVQQVITSLYELVGTLEITGAEPGASIVIGGLDRGEYPPSAPLRVNAGTVVVRVVKDGFEPFETRVDVAGGHTTSVVVKLKSMTASGRLKISEQSGQTVDVLVDGVVVGKTPWEGTQSVGSHVIVLRGQDDLGTQPAAAPVKRGEITTLSLRAEPLEATLRVEPTPASAAVSVDSVVVGRGAWGGRLRAGKHHVEVSSEGYSTARQDITIAPGGRQILPLELKRDDSSPMWRKPPKWPFEVSIGAALTPSFGGDVSDSCKKDCSRSLGAGALIQLHGGYELSSGLGFGVSAGYLAAFQDAHRGDAQIIPAVKQAPVTGTLDESVRIQGGLAGATLSYRFGDSFPVLLRVGGGVLVGRAFSERQGKFDERESTEPPAGGQTNPDEQLSFQTAPASTSQWMAYVYVEPELRLGWRVTERFEVGVGLRALLLFVIVQPRWDSKIELDASTHGIATYPDERLLGSFIPFVAPGASLRYDF